jgi:hypothetical protein
MSTYESVRQFVDKYAVRLGSILILVCVVAAVASIWVDPLETVLTKQRVFEVLIIALLLDIIWRFVDLQSVPPLRLMKNQGEAMPVLIQHVREKQPKTVKMFEYSTSTIGDLLRALRDNHVEIKLLVFDPDASPISDLQEGLIRQRLDLLNTLILKDYPKVEIRLYSTPASLRGRLIGTLLNVGWYTYYYHEGAPDLVGDENPMLLIDAANTSEGVALADMFEKAFDEAWKEGRPYPLPRQRVDSSNR